jgi:transposase
VIYSTRGDYQHFSSDATGADIVQWDPGSWPAGLSKKDRANVLSGAGSVDTATTRLGTTSRAKNLRIEYKVFGAIEYFSGRLFHQGLEGRLTSDSYQEFLRIILAHTKEHLFLIHDGARYHTSQATQQFLAIHRERITAYPLPSYSPDYNPIEYLWKKTKKRATHNQYFKEFAALTISVDKALTYFATHPDMVLGLFGRYCEESGLELKQAA